MADMSSLNPYELNDDEVAEGLVEAYIKLDQIRNGEIDHEKHLQRLRLKNLQDFLRTKEEQIKAQLDKEAQAEVRRLEAEFAVEENIRRKKESLRKQLIQQKQKEHEADGMSSELSEEELDAIEAQLEAHKEINKLIEDRVKNTEKIIKLSEEAAKKEEKKKKRKKGQELTASAFDEIFGKKEGSGGWSERISAIKNFAVNPETGATDAKFGVAKAFNMAKTAALDYGKKIMTTADEIGKHKSSIDTRLYGSKADLGFLDGGSYFENASRKFTSIAGASPFILQADLMASLEKLVGTGISQNVQQRAFLDTVTNKIATTFDVTDGTLLKLVRVQQADTTAARLGMESALNSLLNEMYETTEYLQSLADTVRGNIYEAQALMGAKEATEFEFQVQKWLGSMNSVGMSDQAITSLSTALGQLAAGEIEAVTNGGTGNLLVMAANAAGLPISDILDKGLTAETTNELLNAAVEYLGTIAKQSDSKVIQQQLAGVFGMKASDLKAIVNLQKDDTISNLAGTSKSYGDMMTELENRLGTMYQRISMGEMITNVWSNMEYSMAGGMARSPASYLAFKMGGMLRDMTGGIAIPALSYMGTGFDLETTVADLIQVAAISGPVMMGLGSAIAGLGNSFSGKNMLKTLGINSNLSVVNRGLYSGAGTNTLGELTSEQGSVLSNGSVTDITQSTEAEAAGTAEQKLQEGMEEQQYDATNQDIVDAIGENTDQISGLSDSVDQLSNIMATGLGIGVGGITPATGAGNNKNFSSF